MLSQRLLVLGGLVWDAQPFIPVTGSGGETCGRDLGGEPLSRWILKLYAKQLRNALLASPHPTPLPDPHPKTCPPG